MNVKTDDIRYHSMCPQCSKYLGEYSNTVNSKKVCTCDSIVDGSAIDSLFIDINIESQIRKLFANPVVQKYLEHQPQQNQNDDTFKDVFDGKVHKEYEKKDGSKWNYRYTFNTDGCKAADHAHLSTWLINIMLYELPKEMRRKYMILAGL
uniref:Uncharacterized protein n=1 Tax=Trichogramma kaykai TaxID=54128 RepID=A0ABD2WH88_9HYME